MTSSLSIVHGVLTLDVGGLERVVLDLAREQVAAGHRVAVVCVEHPGELAPLAEAAGARVVALGKPPGRDPEYAGRAATALKVLAPDVVHTHQLGAAYTLAPAARVVRAPVLHTEHGDPFARAAGRLARLKLRLLYRRVGRDMGRVCCVSPAIADSVAWGRTVPRSCVEVVPNGVTLDPAGLPDPAAVRASLGLTAADQVIGTVGRLAEVKRQDVLIRAFASLSGRNPAARLVLVGAGPEQTNLERLAAELGVADRVRFAGYQPQPEAFHRAFDVFALTSRSEGFPVSLLEAWAAGKPVVATAVGGIPAVVRDAETGLLVPAGDDAAVGAALARVLADSALAARLGAAGRAEVVARYALPAVAAGYARRYRDLLPDGAESSSRRASGR